MLKSLKIGDEAEQEVMAFLETLGLCPIKNDDKNTRLFHDIHCIWNENEFSSSVDRVIKFEVKNDVMAHKTGNVAIEYYNSKSNKASGITATKADWWVHKITGNLWIIRVSDLLTFTKEEKPHKIINGGGDKNADLLIYKVDHFTEKCRLLTDITSIEELL